MERRSLLDETFRLSIIFKGMDGVLEIIGGLLVLWISPRAIDSMVATLTQYELSRDPRDFIVTHVLSASHGLAHAGKTLAAIYLLSHGLAKVALVIALLYNKLWAYPSMIALLTLFVAYQLYRVSYAYSLGLILLTLFDVFVIWLTWKEYKKNKLGQATLAKPH